MSTKEFKVGSRVRINVPWRADKHGKEGEVSALALNGALIRFENGGGTIVRLEYLELIEETP